MSRAYRTMYIYYKKSLDPVFEVQFDRIDGELEWVKFFDEISGDWSLADMENMRPSTLEFINEQIAKELEGDAA